MWVFYWAGSLYASGVQKSWDCIRKEKCCCRAAPTGAEGANMMGFVRSPPGREFAEAGGGGGGGRRD